MPTRILFLYPIFPVVPFRRIISACGAFIVAFGTASTIVFVFQCVPIRDSWVTADGNLPSTGGGRCLNLFKFQLANGCINTFTDFTLVLLVGDIFARHLCGELIRATALTASLAFEGKQSAKVYPDWYLRHWFNVCNTVGPLLSTYQTNNLRAVLLQWVWYGWLLSVDSEIRMLLVSEIHPRLTLPSSYCAF